MSKILINSLFVLLSITVAIIAADVGLRLFSSITPRSGQFIPEPKNYQRLNARTATLSPDYSGVLNGRDFSDIPIKTNRLGFRDDEYDFAGLAGSKPILFLGDSYLFGWGVKRADRATDLLSDALHQQGFSAPLLNMSLPGAGTYQALDLLEEFGLPLEPRLIVLGFFVGNDFLDNQAGAIIGPSKRSLPGEGLPSLKLLDRSEHSRTVSLRELLRTSPVFNLIKYGLWKSATFRSLFNRFEIQNDRIALYEHETRPSDELYASTLKALDSFVDLADKSGIPVLVLLIPDHLQLLQPELFLNYDRRKPQRVLTEHLTQLDTEFLDLLPVFDAVPDPGQLFFREDKHWSRDGNALVSRALIAPTLRILADTAGSATHGAHFKLAP